MLSGMTLPILSNLLGENEKEKYKKMLIMNSLGLLAIALVVAIPVCVFSQTIMSSYGKDFAGEWQVMVYISAYSVLWASHIVVGQAMWSTGASGEAMIFAAIRSVILLSSGALLVKYGAVGLSLALLITYIIQTIYLIPYVKYKTDRYFADSESEHMKMAEPLCQMSRSQ
jgi:O-antigen/teichoic acid export membrane protein